MLFTAAGPATVMYTSIEFLSKGIAWRFFFDWTARWLRAIAHLWTDREQLNLVRHRNTIVSASCVGFHCDQKRQNAWLAAAWSSWGHFVRWGRRCALRIADNDLVGLRLFSGSRWVKGLNSSFSTAALICRLSRVGRNSGVTCSLYTWYGLPTISFSFSLNSMLCVSNFGLWHWSTSLFLSHGFVAFCRWETYCGTSKVSTARCIQTLCGIARSKRFQTDLHLQLAQRHCLHWAFAIEWPTQSPRLYITFIFEIFIPACRSWIADIGYHGKTALLFALGVKVGLFGVGGAKDFVCQSCLAAAESYDICASCCVFKLRSVILLSVSMRGRHIPIQPDYLWPCAFNSAFLLFRVHEMVMMPGLILTLWIRSCSILMSFCFWHDFYSFVSPVVTTWILVRDRSILLWKWEIFCLQLWLLNEKLMFGFDMQ